MTPCLQSCIKLYLSNFTPFPTFPTFWWRRILAAVTALPHPSNEPHGVRLIGNENLSSSSDLRLLVKETLKEGSKGERDGFKEDGVIGEGG